MKSNDARGVEWVRSGPTITGAGARMRFYLLAEKIISSKPLFTVWNRSVPGGSTRKSPPFLSSWVASLQNFSYHSRYHEMIKEGRL